MTAAGAELAALVDRKMDIVRNMDATLDRIARGLFHSWIEERECVDTFDDFDLGPIPSGWRWGRIGDVADIDPQVQMVAHAVSGSLKVVIPEHGGVREREPDAKETKVSGMMRLLMPGDTVIHAEQCMRETRMASGCALVVEKGWVADEAYLLARPRRPEYAAFVYLALTAPDTLDFFASQARTRGASGIRPGQLEGYSLALPDEETMERFHAIAWPILLRMDANRREAELFSRLVDHLPGPT